MKIVSFNVNSVRLRLHQLQAVIERHNPDVIGLQETKATDADFPVADIEAMGYHVEYFGQKTHYGVAMMSRMPFERVAKGLPGDDDDAQKRLITGWFKTANGQDLVVCNGYFPQGEKRDHPVKFPGKEKFYAGLNDWMRSDFKSSDPLAIIGDYNVAPVDVDIGIGPDSTKRWLRDGKASFLPEEREWFETLRGWGLTDTYRSKYPDSSDFYSWFDYRSRGFEREPKRGLRIDHILATSPLADNLIDSGIDYEIRGMEKPSDHCPVWSEFNFD